MYNYIYYSSTDGYLSLFIIFIIAPPMVTYLSFDDTLVITAPLKLEIMCSASGRPVPTITWYRNGNEISLGGNNSK